MLPPVRPSSASRGPCGVQRGLQELHGDLLEPSSGWRRLRRLQLHHREERHQQRPVDARHLFLHEDHLQGEQIGAEMLRGKDRLNYKKCRQFVGRWAEKLFNNLHQQLKSVTKTWDVKISTHMLFLINPVSTIQKTPMLKTTYTHKETHTHTQAEGLCKDLWGMISQVHYL